ncbi:MAG: hypothetical protein JWM19_7579 [Actinomycetia bacterium]|nr:hypothetical protein [Actinomycetes bacterium]
MRGLRRPDNRCRQGARGPGGRTGGSKRRLAGWPHAWCANGVLDRPHRTWHDAASGAAPAAHAEILAQRTRIGELLGQVRDLEAEWTQEAVQRITSENTTLKQRVRQLTADNRSFDERLQAARSNLRFQDRRIADLEAHIADPGTTR